MRFWRWLTGRSVPDLGDIREGVQHGRLVQMDGKQYLLVDSKHLPDQHDEVKLTFIPHPRPQSWPLSYADLRRLGLGFPESPVGEMSPR